MNGFRSNGSPLATMRCKFGYSQKQLAKLCKLSVTSIRNWEQGIADMSTASASTIYKISMKLNWDQSMLISSMHNWFDWFERRRK